MTDTIPGRGQYTEDARRERLNWLRERNGTALASLESTGLTAQNLVGNVENFIGSVEVPVGLAGPLLFVGDAARGSIVAPFATSEGALVASASRGARAISASGGVTTAVLSQRMTRAPVFEFADIATAQRFTAWLHDQRDRLEEQVGQVSRYTRLVDIDPYQIGRYLHVRFVFETADAAGQNMTTAATWQICRWLTGVLAAEDELRPRDMLLEGNLSGDKKVTTGSMLAGRGTRVTAEARLSRDVVASVLKTTPEAMVKCYTATLLGAQQAGMTGYGVNAANVVAALFTATGQDVACVHESGVSLFSLEMDGDHLLATILLPNLVAGTVGGGTALPHQRDLLTALGCAGAGGVRRFAEIVAGFALALDVSTMAAVVSGQFADAHQRLGRARRVDWLQDGDLDAVLLQPVLAQGLGDPRLHVTEVSPSPQLYGDGISSELGALGERRKLTGLHPLTVSWTDGDGTAATTEMVAKVKPRGEEVVAGIAMLVSLCGPDVARAWNCWGADTEFTDTHRREPAVYRRPEPVLTSLLPRCYGVLEDDEREAYVVLMERLRDDGGPWTPDRIDAALRAIARVHGHWLDRDQELLDEGWLHRVPEPAHLAKSRELWEALVRHAVAELPALVDAPRANILLGIVEDAGYWTQELQALPRTLVHNDFNPRNIALRDGRPVVYDWELATVDVPQRDVVELLAFCLGPQTTTEEVDRFLAVHARAVAAVSPEAAAVVARSGWHRGYQLALRRFMTTRLALYAAGHSQREFDFLPRVLETTFRLWSLEQSRDGE
ncbi:MULTISPECIES: phosphotransferase [unclassified Streptomyces]|uniref:phosphotransferase n=1 Tax=unclassified Streptomyces TaxID=2593676 RepID=UPI00081BA56F|nr:MULTISPECIES: phosphotransferase [unclassified Streptomyces]MYQ82932.1 phosphotransferase [Streptomyces sp. SID4936]SCD55657.1 3-hydroxy-3-methylglutaryl-coenzyme A reductase [Streptomyces sp. DvalAA-43]